MGQGSDGEQAGQGGTITILVVDDEPEVRELAVKMLDRLGYRTVEAVGGQDALVALETSPEIAVLFTDVMLASGMSGAGLAEEAQRRHPGLKVLFTSGYSRDELIDRGRLRDGVQLVAKPYRRSELAHSLDAVLKR